MAARTWNSSGSTDLNDGNNYTPTGAILATDDITFDGTSVVNAIATANYTVNSITATAAFSGNFDMAGFTLDHGTFDITGATGSWTIDSTWNSTGNITWTSSVSDFFQTGATLNANASLTITGRNLGTKSLTSMFVAASTTVTLGADFSFLNDDGTSLTLTDGTSTFDISSSNLRIFSMGTFTPIVLNGGTISSLVGGDILFTPVAGNLTCTMPAINDTDLSITIFGLPANGEIQRFNFGGNIICELLDTFHSVGGSTGEVIIDMKTFNLEQPSNNFVIQATSGTNTGKVTANYGTGTHKVKGYAMKSDVGADLVMNWESSTLEHGNTVDYKNGGAVIGTLTVNPGTSTTKYTGTSNRFMTSSGVVHNNYEITSATGGITLLDDFAAKDFNNVNGIFDTNGNGFNIGDGNITLDSNDALTFDAAFTFEGNIIIDAAVVSFTHTGTVEADGTGVQQITSAGETFDIIKNSNTAGSLELLDSSDMTRLLLEPGSTIKKKESVSHTVASYTSGDISGTSGNLVTIRSLLNGTAANFVNPAGMSDVEFVDVKDNNATNLVTATNSVDSGGNTNWNIIDMVSNERGVHRGVMRGVLEGSL